MSDVPMKTYWRGRDIEEMSREELIAVVRSMGALQREFYSHRAIRARALGSVEMMKRGELLSSDVSEG